MKNKIQFLLAACLLAIAAVFTFSAFDRTPVPFEDIYTIEDESGNVTTAAAPSSNAIVKSWVVDTITNAENDTLLLGEILASAYQYAYQIRMANISGTRSIKFYLEQTSATGSSRWMTVDSAITSGAVINNYLMRNANTWGNRHRIIIDGTGTQSISYKIDGWLKRTN